jgi:hypothetical protein
MNQSDLYKKSIKNPKIDEPINLIFYRRVGFVLAKLFTHTPITANGVTILSMISGIAAGLFYSAGESTKTIIAGILFFTYNVLDCTDGQLARLNGTSSKFGRMLDGFADYVTGIAIFVGITIGYSGQFYNIPIWWGLAIFASVSNIFQSVLVDTYRTRFTIWSTGQSQNMKDELKEYEAKCKNKASKRHEKLIYQIYCRYLHLGTKISPSESHTFQKMDYDRLIQKNKRLVRGWSIIGPSMRISVAIIVSFFNRPDLYFLAIVIPFNLLTLFLYPLQLITDAKERKINL